MNINAEGNVIGVIIEADNLLTQIAKQRLAAKEKVLKPVAKTESKPKVVQKSTATVKA
tara:strand:+ start:237 stop:410 length:174 start_codon:yes stop_codon:yes gene_type:complete